MTIYFVKNDRQVILRCEIRRIAKAILLEMT